MPKQPPRTREDGLSRQFDHDSRDPRMVAAIVIASRDGWGEIRPGHWALAGAIVAAQKRALTRGAAP